jgi:outer membrane murein-binding lipoprotein Lpp
MKNSLPKIRLTAVFLGMLVLAGCATTKGMTEKTPAANAEQTANDAKTTADQALSKADQALTTANQAKQESDQTRDEMNQMFKKYQRK